MNTPAHGLPQMPPAPSTFNVRTFANKVTDLAKELVRRTSPYPPMPRVTMDQKDLLEEGKDGSVEPTLVSDHS